MMLLGYPPMYPPRYRSPHVRDFTTPTLKLALRNYGFEVERMVGGTSWFPIAGDCLSWLATWVPSWSTTLIVQAIKRAESQYNPDQNIRVNGFRLHL